MIDTSKALAEPGVLAVVTYQDVPTWTQGIFAWGQEVAGVVAEDYFTAVRACQLIDVTYETGTLVWDVESALQASSPLAIPGGNAQTGTNVGNPSQVTRGDVEAGFAACRCNITREQPWTTTYAHNMLEPHGAVAWWIGPDVYVWYCSQDVHSGKNSIVNSLGMPANRVHGYTHGTGGGHGDKTGYRAGRAGGHHVAEGKWTTRSQVVAQRNVHNTIATRQFETKQSIKVGAKNDGTLVAYDVPPTPTPAAAASSRWP